MEPSCDTARPNVSPRVQNHRIAFPVDDGVRSAAVSLVPMQEGPAILLFTARRKTAGETPAPRKASASWPIRCLSGTRTEAGKRLRLCRSVRKNTYLLE